MEQSQLRTNSHGSNHKALCSNTHVDEVDGHFCISSTSHFQQFVSDDG